MVKQGQPLFAFLRAITASLTRSLFSDKEPGDNEKWQFHLDEDHTGHRAQQCLKIKFSSGKG